MDLTPKHEHDLWVAAFTAALSESAIKLIDSPGSPATGGDRVGVLVGKAVEIANLAQELYKGIWDVDLVDPVLSPGDRAAVIRGLRAGLAGCLATPEKFTVMDLQNARVRLVRALRVFGIADTAAETEIQPYEGAEIPCYALEISGPLFRAQRQLLSKLAQKKPRTSTGTYLDEDLLHGLIDLTDEIADQAHDNHGVDCLLEDVADADEEAETDDLPDTAAEAEESPSPDPTAGTFTAPVYPGRQQAIGDRLNDELLKVLRRYWSEEGLNDAVSTAVLEGLRCAWPLQDQF